MMNDVVQVEQNRTEKSSLETVKAIFRLRMEHPTTITTYLCLLVVMLLLSLTVGIYLFTLPANQEIKVVNYGNKFGCKQVLGLETACETEIYLDEDMEGPVLVNYELTNFISNSKDYLTSKSHKQLSGEHINKAEASKCEPYVTNAQMGVTQSWAGQPLNPDDIASPCGLQAKLYFRDSFEIIMNNSSIVPIRTTNLISKFTRQPNSEAVQWIDPTLDSFEVWMTTTVSVKLMKIYGVVDQKMPRGKYTLRIRNRSNYSMEVEKNIVLVRERNEFGNSRMLGCMAMGGSILLLVFLLTYYVCEFVLKKCMRAQ